MNLYFRLIWLFLWRNRHCNKIDFLDTSRLAYRALPTDCDINFHLTNSRYPAFMDLARTYMMAEMGFLKRFLKLGWMPIVNAAEFTYIRDIKPFAKFEIETKLVGWDEKYFYIEQRFVSARGLHCIAHVRGVFVCKGKQVAIATMLAEVGFNEPAPQLPPEVIKWKSFLLLKKECNLPSPTGEPMEFRAAS
ncbi:thioesterase family protein [Shewanella schlegeliana]|uniref:Thioesterase family protein n=1 Tax=Shewanella schlegeliana TaxID=190308 RepID=A0ABS1T1R6_9GAMM|nr:thioesterase family protein [Shewanella schlegeliana]MBL4914746.1 thioesterase family protein [Shewanella schlegeliana]MCL1109922.1 thioesterase family protein [Shewanella schlegeliana]GIU25638.1 thioesterase [Shewanella schlegeliana]